jgi:hypothetical protein
MPEANLTDRQQKWFATIRTGLERDTGKTMEQWVATAWSRGVQFAAARPVKGGKAMLGLAVAADAGARLEAPKNESWSERLKARVLLASPAEVDAGIAALLRAA